MADERISTELERVREQLEQLVAEVRLQREQITALAQEVRARKRASAKRARTLVERSTRPIAKRRPTSEQIARARRLLREQ